MDRESLSHRHLRGASPNATRCNSGMQLNGRLTSLSQTSAPAPFCWDSFPVCTTTSDDCPTLHLPSSPLLFEHTKLANRYVRLYHRGYQSLFSPIGRLSRCPPNGSLSCWCEQQSSSSSHAKSKSWRTSTLLGMSWHQPFLTCFSPNALAYRNAY